MEPLMQENRVFNPPADFVKSAAISGMDAYNKLCAEANNDYDGFWGRLAKENVFWKSPLLKFLMNPKHLSTSGLKMALPMLPTTV